MKVTSKVPRGVRCLAVHFLGPALLMLLAIGCARLPVPMQVIHDDQYLLIRTERVQNNTGNYSHPIDLQANEITVILRGITVQERPNSWPLRLFGKTAGPDRLFHDDDIQELAPYLADGLHTAKPNERVSFALYAPGPNPEYERYVTSGWVAVRGPFFHIAIDYVRTLQPRSPTHNYDPFYPEMPPAPSASNVLFEPHEFWRADPVDGNSAVQFRDYLRTVIP